MKTLASAFYLEDGPFLGLKGINTVKAVHHPRELDVNDVLVVWGGGDIHPSLYNKKLSKHSHASKQGPTQRDTIEWNLMKEALDLEIPIIGVCRGAQMLTALYGGHLIQHVDNHAGRDHSVVTYDGLAFNVNSIHHQMMVPSPNHPHRVVAQSPKRLSQVYMDEDTNVSMDIEPEFIHYFGNSPGFAIQWHPEMMNIQSHATRYILDYINQELT